MRHIVELCLLPLGGNTYMNALGQTIGNQIDGEPRDSSQCANISTTKLVSLRDLLVNLEDDDQIAMLRTTAGHVANFLNAPIEKVRIDALVGIVPDFRVYLKQKRYKPNAVNSYCNYAGMLLRKAEEHGWESSNPEIPESWQPILSAVKSLKGASGIVNFGV